MANQGWRLPVALALITLVGSIATAVIANWNTIFPPVPSPNAVLADQTVTRSPASDRVAVNNVYNLPEQRGLDILHSQGFTNIRVLRVCSNSVSAGRIREVLLDNNAPVSDETALVNQYGSTGIEIALGTKIAVKVSTGQGC